MRNRKYFELNNRNTVFKILLFVMKIKLITLNAYNRKEERQKKVSVMFTYLKMLQKFNRKKESCENKDRNMFTIFLTTYYFLLLLITINKNKTKCSSRIYNKLWYILALNCREK